MSRVASFPVVPVALACGGLSSTLTICNRDRNEVECDTLLKRTQNIQFV